MPINTAIIEDDPEQIRLLKSYLAAFGKARYNFAVSAFESAEPFLSSFSKGQYQLLFMDIQLPGLDGLSAAKRVRQEDGDVAIVFITSLPQFAINGYEVDARDFIVKPLIFDDFCRKMKRIMRYVDIEADATRLISIAGAKDQTVIIAVNELMFVEIFGHKLVYHCTDGDYEVYGKLSDVEAQLAPYNFLRCNRSTLINPKHIKHICGNTIQLGDHEVLISSPRKKEFMRKLNNWMVD